MFIRFQVTQQTGNLVSIPTKNIVTYNLEKTIRSKLRSSNDTCDTKWSITSRNTSDACKYNNTIIPFRFSRFSCRVFLTTTCNRLHNPPSSLSSFPLLVLFPQQINQADLGNCRCTRADDTGTTQLYSFWRRNTTWRIWGQSTGWTDWPAVFSFSVERRKRPGKWSTK